MKGFLQSISIIQTTSTLQQVLPGDNRCPGSPPVRVSKQPVGGSWYVTSCLVPIGGAIQHKTTSRHHPEFVFRIKSRNIQRQGRKCVSCSSIRNSTRTRPDRFGWEILHRLEGPIRNSSRAFRSGLTRVDSGRQKKIVDWTPRMVDLL